MTEYLPPNNEITGKLDQIKISEDKVKLLLTFTIEKEISVLYDADLFKKLHDLIGHKISVLNIDDKRFFVKEVENK